LRTGARKWHINSAHITRESVISIGMARHHQRMARMYQRSSMKKRIRSENGTRKLASA